VNTTELEQLLENEQVTLNRLLELLEKERAALLRADAAGVDAVRGEKEAVLNSIHQLEQDRLRIQAVLGKQLSLPQESLTLTRLIQALPKESGSRLRETGASMRAAADAAAAANRQNRDLAHHTIELVERSLSFFNNVLNKGAVYAKCGAVDALPRSGRVIASEA
jgi:flagellar biosynthesis/type III secretory pathway chaperone